jgi:hypothetical protein
VGLLDSVNLLTTPHEASSMDMSCIVSAVLDDLVLVASFEPNERLPKEEQTRCCIYAAIRPLFAVVCAEHGYGSIDDGSRVECDLWARSSDGAPAWLEFKRCWCAKGWNNKPKEQLCDWQADVDKLRKVPVASERYFLLVGFFDFDPISESDVKRGQVVRNIRKFHPSQLVCQTSKEFAWRKGDGIKWAGAWVWHWASGVPVEETA